MTKEDTSARGVPYVTRGGLPDHERREIAFHAACHRFAASLMSLQLAVQTGDQVPGAAFLLEREYTIEKAQDMHAKWAAVSIVMHEAIDDLVANSTALSAAMKDLVIQ